MHEVLLTVRQRVAVAVQGETSAAKSATKRQLKGARRDSCEGYFPKRADVHGYRWTVSRLTSMQVPTKFELMINLKTLKALGVNISRAALRSFVAMGA